jgi:hypothetical protein|tara:strand:+ start:687 stop:800 length:114 start_codon:yes stop_codon:yes gene_type:complete
MKKIIDWVKNYPFWTKKDYMIAGFTAIAVIAIVGSIF